MKNKALFRAKMAIKEMTYKGLADRVGISQVSLSNKVNGKAEFLLKETEAIADILDLTEEEYLEIFIKKFNN